MNNIISPIRKLYTIFACITFGIVLLGAIPFCFCGENLEGFFFVYFITYISTVVSLLIFMCIAFPFVRNAEIKFFKNKFNLENMENLVDFNLKNEDFIFNVNGLNIEFKRDKIKNLQNNIEYPYNEFKIHASYQCWFAGEIYKIFINFENEKQNFSLKLDNVLYSIIKYYKISVDNLENVMNECENNLKTFFKSKELKKEACEKAINQDLNELIEPILNVLGDKASYFNHTLNIKYHDDFIIKYDFSLQTMYINEKYFCCIEAQDLFDYLNRLNNDMFYIVEYNCKQFITRSYFKLLLKKKTNVSKINKKNIVRIFDINNLICEKKQAE